MSTPPTPQSVYVDLSAAEWQPTAIPGVRMKLLWKDEAGEGFTALFQAEPGARLPRHRHRGVEQTFVLEGSLVDEEGICTAGNFVWRRAGSIHSAWTPDGCLAIGVFSAPNEFLEDLPDSR